MVNRFNNIIEQTLVKIIAEQAKPAKQETDNAPSDAVESPFTPAEEKFLGKFDANGTKHIGILYSVSDIGIREFITRSGKTLNLTPEILLNLIRTGIIKIVPYTGFGKNDDYTLELQLSLNDVAGLGTEDKKAIEAGSDASGAPSADAAPLEPELAWVMKYGTIITESAKIIKKLLDQPIIETKNNKIDIYTNKSRLLKRFPKDFIYHMKRMINMMDKKTKNTNEKERIVADVLDNLQVNFKLTPKNIRQSYEMHKNQKKLQNMLKKT